MASFKAKVAVFLERPTYTISRLLHGLIVKHIGDAIYDGIWIAEGSGYSKFSGLRTKLVDTLRRIRPGIVRWPGGCFVNTYHWEDGIGPKKNRTSRHNLWCEGEESNQFGTDEFINFCNKIVAEPYICLNTSTGSIREALDWLEYCNLEHNTGYSRLRTQYGNPEPFKVNYWKVGNEPWGCGGNFEPHEYAGEFRHYASFLKRADPFIQLVACGHIEPQWNYTLLENFRGYFYLIDHLSLHSTFSTEEYGGGSQPKTDHEYYSLFGYLPLFESQILSMAETITKIVRNKKKIGIALDRWGVQHPDALPETGLRQAGTLRDGLMAGCTLHLLHRFSDRISMANLAQSVNALHSLVTTKKEAIIKTPTYHIFDLLQDHIGNMSLETKVVTPKFKTQDRLTRQSLPLIDVSASLNQNSRQLTLTLINLHIEKEAEVTIYIEGGGTLKKGNAMCITADSPNEENTFEDPHRVEPQKAHIDRIDNPIDQKFPPQSLTRIQLQIG